MQGANHERNMMMEPASLLKNDERIDQLYSQDVQIIQSPSCFAFSLDAVLLANFVRPNHRHKQIGRAHV